RAVPGRDSIDLLVRDLRRDLAAGGVDVRLGVEATAASLRDARPDGIVVATGAVAPLTTARAIGGAYVGGFPGEVTVDAFAAASDPTALGRRIAVIDADGTAYASGIVLTLLAAVDELTLITPFETAFPHVGAGYDRPLLFEHLSAHRGFDRRVSHRVDWVEGGYLAVSDVLTGRLTTLDGLDAIVAIEPRSAVLIPGLEDDGLPHTRIVTIGDAFAPRTIDAAIFEAVELAYDIAGMATLRG
ncbi:MAG: hypothetical protein ABWZ16_09720, partial [Microbacterium sp.]